MSLYVVKECPLLRSADVPEPKVIIVNEHDSDSKHRSSKRLSPDFSCSTVHFEPVIETKDPLL
jgi:hypothetical protein